MESAAVAEAGCGIVRLCWTGETDLSERHATFIAKAVEDLRSWVMHNGGSLVILSAPPAIKMLVDVWGPVGSALSLMQNLKQQFDPQRLLNPGRFVGGI
jgi:glycolate oxidase FAD binding subunit